MQTWVVSFGCCRVGIQLLFEVVFGVFGVIKVG